MKKLLLILSVPALFMTSCTKTTGKISLTYNKATAVYGDIEAIRSTPLSGTPSAVNDAGKIFVGENYLLIGEKGEGIHIFDNTNPNAPNNVGFINLPFTREFFVENDVIYAESQYDFVKVDISDMYNPKLIDRVEFAFGEPNYNDEGEVIVGFDYQIVTESFELGSPEAEALEESASLYYDYKDKLIPISTVPSSFAGTSSDVKGTLNKISVLNDYVYVIGASEIYVIGDVLGDLQLVNKVNLPTWDVETIYAEGQYLFIGSQSSMVVMDASNPEHPSEVSSYFHPTSCDPVLPYGNLAYLTLRSADNSGCAGDENTLTILDISDINNPEPLNSIPMNSPYGMSITNGYLWVGEGNNGLTLFDNHTASIPVEMTTFQNVYAYDIIQDPFDANVILTTGDFGLQQYLVDYANEELTLLSDINY